MNSIIIAAAVFFVGTLIGAYAQNSFTFSRTPQFLENVMPMETDKDPKILKPIKVLAKNKILVYAKNGLQHNFQCLENLKEFETIINDAISKNKSIRVTLQEKAYIFSEKRIHLLIIENLEII